MKRIALCCALFVLAALTAVPGASADTGGHDMLRVRLKLPVIFLNATGACPQGIATYRLRTTDDSRALEIATHQPGVGEVRFEDDGLSLAADEDAAAGLSIALVEAGLGIRALVPAAASLEELFFRLTEGDTNGANGAAQRKEVAV